MYQIQTAQFKGPLEKLLELIEAKKMEITQLNLGVVTDDFLNYLESIKNEAGNENRQKSEEELRLLADFIVVASKLILIKSKALLPVLELSIEETEDIKDLENRLRFYKKFKPAIAIVKSLYIGKNFSFSRQLFSNRPIIFSPSKNVSVEKMNESMEKIFVICKQLTIETQTIETTLIKLEEKIEEIISKVQTGIKNFGHLIKEKSKKEIVVMFLALLHLLREQVVEVEQTEGFSEIIIKKSSDSD